VSSSAWNGPSGRPGMPLRNRAVSSQSELAAGRAAWGRVSTARGAQPWATKVKARTAAQAVARIWCRKKGTSGEMRMSEKERLSEPALISIRGRVPRGSAPIGQAAGSKYETQSFCRHHPVTLQASPQLSERVPGLFPACSARMPVQTDWRIRRPKDSHCQMSPRRLPVWLDRAHQLQGVQHSSQSAVLTRTSATTGDLQSPVVPPPGLHSNHAVHAQSVLLPRRVGSIRSRCHSPCGAEAPPPSTYRQTRRQI